MNKLKSTTGQTLTKVLASLSIVSPFFLSLPPSLSLPFFLSLSPSHNPVLPQASVSSLYNIATYHFWKRREHHFLQSGGLVCSTHFTSRQARSTTARLGRAFVCRWLLSRTGMWACVAYGTITSLVFWVDKHSNLVFSHVRHQRLHANCCISNEIRPAVY